MSHVSRVHGLSSQVPNDWGAAILRGSARGITAWFSHFWLVVWTYPSEKWDFVSWDYFSQYMEIMFFFLVGSATYMWYTGWWCNNRNHLEKYEFVNGKDEIPYIMENNFCLVVWTLWKIWIRQLGWWFSIYGNIKKSSKPPTRSGLIPMTSPFSNGFPMVFLWNGDLWFFNMFWSHLT